MFTIEGIFLFNCSYALRKILSPNFGLDLEQYLFENISNQNGDLIGNTIYEEFALYEPRVTVNSVDIIARPDQNEYKISISITIPSLNNKKAVMKGRLTGNGYILT